LEKGIWDSLIRSKLRVHPWTIKGVAELNHVGDLVHRAKRREVKQGNELTETMQSFSVGDSPPGQDWSLPGSEFWVGSGPPKRRRIFDSL
jgi:hypothetical protein